MMTSFTKGTGETLRTAGALSTVGLAFVFALVIGFWFGSVLDRGFGTKPILTIAFFFLGLAAGILNVYRIVSQASQGQPAGTSPAATPPPAGGTPGDRDLSDDGE